MTLRSHVRKLQQLENKAAEKAGMRFMVLDEKKLMGGQSEKYVKEFVERLTTDIGPEVLKSAQMGKALVNKVNPSQYQKAKELGA